MRALASAYTLTQAVDSRLDIVWFRDWGMQAAFSDIFEPTPLLPVREATWSDYLLYDRARQKNLFLTKLPQWLLFDRRIKEQRIWYLKRDGFDFEAWARGHRCYMSCYQVFGTFPDALYGKLFQPVSEVVRQVDAYRRQFSAHTVGLHIRRTDNAESIAKSPTSLFVDKMKAEIDGHDDTKVFLATDDEAVKQEFRSLFGQRVITPAATATRSSVEGIRGGLVDLYTLAATQKIYGSAGSSFSPMAASVGGTPLEIVSQNS
jgi:hypothetical protein